MNTTNKPNGPAVAGDVTFNKIISKQALATIEKIIIFFNISDTIYEITKTHLFLRAAATSTFRV